MLQLMVANDYIIQVEVEFEETKKKTVSWLHRAENRGAERYKELASLIDKNSSPPPRATEWGFFLANSRFEVVSSHLSCCLRPSTRLANISTMSPFMKLLQYPPISTNKTTITKCYFF